MPRTFETTRGDTGRELEATLYRPSGAVVDLTNCTIKLLLVSQRAGNTTYTRLASLRNSPGTDGVVYYAFVSGDFSGGSAIPAGAYWIQWEITDGAGKKTTILHDYDKPGELMTAELFVDRG